VSPPVYPPGTTTVVGESQEPVCLNAYLTCGSLQATFHVTAPILAGAYRQRPDLTFEPVLVSSVDVEVKPFTLTYHLKPEAQWSDGFSLTSDDLLFTLDAILDPANEIASRTGYDLVTSATPIDSKTVRFVFSEPYAAWKTLFPQVLPAHALAGQDFDTALLDSIPVSSGPYTFDSWQKGTQLTLTRTPSWWSTTQPSLERIVFRFIQTSDARVQALLSGELTLMQAFASEVPLLDTATGIDVGRIPGSNLEHIDANTQSSSMPLLAEPWFRKALALALDRDTAIAAAWGSVASGVGPIQSLVYLEQQPEYQAQFDRLAYDPEQVAKLMKRQKCVLGGDGIWSCNGTRASVKLATTTGNPIRLSMQEALVSGAAAAGIELHPDNSTSLELFGTRLPAGDFELVWFAWPRTGDPYGFGSVYGCAGTQNYGKYCSDRVTELLAASDVELKEQSRQSLVNRAGDLLANDIPSVPLYQQPLFLAKHTDLLGVVDSAGRDGFTWNAEEWRFG
jgi:peptide/nickel transport system substrate-binding protein